VEEERKEDEEKKKKEEGEKNAQPLEQHEERAPALSQLKGYQQ
jgi:hypothetical protein